MNIKSSKNLTCVDLYSGIGGWALGFKLCNIKISQSFEWWTQASLTHDLNLSTSTTQGDIRKLLPSKIKKPVDFIVGSPPCTQFSYSNRGGSGDISDGLKDIKKFFELVEYIKPKYWAMENVPRTANVISKELSDGGQLEKFNKLCKPSMIQIYDFSEFGLPQKRKRCIVGNFDQKLLRSYQSLIKKRTLGDVIASLSSKQINDPNYSLTLSSNEVTDNEKESSLNFEEERYNRDSKTFHPVYNNMEFPDSLDKPVRTITATCTRVSRESVVISDKKKYRRLSVRERASCQGFPINYQFHGKSYSSKLKMIGNAIPPVFTYYLANAMLEVPLNELIPLEKIPFELIINKTNAPLTIPETEGKLYSITRSFRFAIPNLRFKSGTRFELNNSQGKLPWKVEFFFGDSKRILNKELSINTKREINSIIKKDMPEFLCEVNNILSENIFKINHYNLQNTWTNRDNKQHPFQLLDHLGLIANKIIKLTATYNNDYFTKLIENFVYINSKEGKPISANKLKSYSKQIIAGLILGSEFNIKNRL